MWKKDDDATDKTGREAGETAVKATGPSAPAAQTGGSRTATIGSAITIKGEVSGDEDLLIQGRVDGSIELGEHSVTVGVDGRVTASIVARVVTVEGRVDGDVRARERILLRSSSQVEGDITAPRVVLEDGARFRGGVDMGEAGKSSSGRSDSTSSKGSSGSGSSSSGSGSSTSGSSASGKDSGSAGSSGGDSSDPKGGSTGSSRREATASGSGKGSSS